MSAEQFAGEATRPERITGENRMNYLCVHMCTHPAQQLNSEEYAMPEHPFRILSALSITYPTSFSKMVSLRHGPTHQYPLNLNP